MKRTVDLSSLSSTIEAAKAVGNRYRELTGKPLGITGEVGEVIGAELLGLTLCDARQAGYDATSNDGRRVQIKTRCLLPDSKRGQRMGSIRLDHEWDSVVLVLLDQDFEPLAVYEAHRAAVETALNEPGSKARNERRALAVSKFKAIGEFRWEKRADLG